jgi:nucleotide-binding universal stress UspA family protein
MKIILLGYDGSSPSSKAFDTAAEMAQRYQAQLHVLTVAEAPEIADEVESEAQIEQSRHRHQHLLHGLTQRGAHFGVQVHMKVAVGHPAQQIIEHAAEQGADLIVLGHRGHGALDRWRLGSVTHRVISYAECAVMVVR